MEKRTGLKFEEKVQYLHAIRDMDGVIEEVWDYLDEVEEKRRLRKKDVKKDRRR